MINFRALPVSVLNSLFELSLGLLVVSVAGQASGAVTLGFDPSTAPPPGPGTSTIPLPWSEGGFTVSSSTVGAGIEYLSRTGPSYSGALFLTSARGLITTVTITDDASRPFDLLAFDVRGSVHLPGITNEATLSSSAGGSLTFLLPLNDTTMTFSGAQWQDLSYVQFQFTAPGSVLGLQRLSLDNVVLQPYIVPEPYMLVPCSLGLGLLLRWRKGVPRCGTTAG